MPKTIFNISEELMKQIDQTIKKWGFESRAEFFRFAAIDFIRNDARLMPSDDILKDHARAIRSVKVRRMI
jgi:metal-responsive CopG/Arc/MetJ family transcriptional regulator